MTNSSEFRVVKGKGKGGLLLQRGERQKKSRAPTKKGESSSV